MQRTIPDREPTLGRSLRPSAAPWWPTALGIAAALGMFVLGSLALLDARRDTWRQAEASARNLLLALDRDIARNLATFDLSLRGVVEALAEPGLDQASPGIRHQALFDRAASAEDLGSILVLNADGDVAEDSTSPTPHRLNLADRDYFRVHRSSPDVGLFLSRPYRSRLAGGDLRISISRRLPSADGRFAGVVAGALRLAYFRRLFEPLDLGLGGSITLFRSDGRILARHPYREEDVDRDLGGSGSFRHFSAARSGQYVTRAAIDGVERLYTFRHVGDLPLILTVNLAVDEVYAPWRRKAVVIGPVLVLLSAAAVASCLLLRREVERRAVAEHALAAASAELAVLASTDALTGLANRRTFDKEIGREWRRAMRCGHAVALLLLDADHFKRYNDRYGHPAGDEVLRAIARCMAAHIRRPGDLAARYGGEEFAVLLPGTDAAGAGVIAERIRAAVAGLGLPHEGNPHGRVTVSIGVAVAWPAQGEAEHQLVQSADGALYAAKHNGRNQAATASQAGAAPAEAA